MANDNQANYAKIGFVLVLGVILILGTLIYLGGVRDVRQEFPVETYFENGVQGLSVGSDVNFRGVKVGRVEAITFLRNRYPECNTPREKGSIWVKLALDRKLCCMEDEADARHEIDRAIADGLHATVAANAVTGLARIELTLKPDLLAKGTARHWKPKYPCIPPAPSLMESAGNTADRILAQIDKINLVDGWTNIVSSLVTAQNVLNGADVILQSESGKISEILDNLRETSSSLRDFADHIKNNPSSLLRSNDPEALPETK